ncbi:ArsR/SmtB family transcription factor [Streptomyces huiliensis]|uniref:ArsR/SmtB family transcription factor n=1 Tax=Streptomyces huiliensis TaxID=2876027 RepID=UPI001CBD8690|nr:ArsR family transcriptional regulator [Streptomyces huiliensis]MBZ4321430.1 ArsR family transcriptional regulator [Streptomyces huiliensis]
MISFSLGVDDLAGTRFAISPLQEVMGSLWVLRDPGRYPLHGPWRREALGAVAGFDVRPLLALVGPSFALPDFLTPWPEGFAPAIEDELAVVRSTPAATVRRDLLATYAPHRPPSDILHAVTAAGDGPVLRYRDRVCDLLQRYWDLVFRPGWPYLRQVLEADVTHRARQLATGGVRLLFSELHPNLRWGDGVLRIDRMIGHHRVDASGRGLPLVPSLFAYKPVPPLGADRPPVLTYPSRGVATAWAPPPGPAPDDLAALLGAPRALLLTLLGEAATTAGLAGRLGVTPSAVSQHLRVLHTTGLVSRVRDGRYVLYRRSGLGDRLVGSTGA